MINATASFLVGRFSKYVPRLIILLTGAAGNVAACAIMFLWIPNRTSIIYYFVTIGLWGMSDAVWQTIINCKSTLNIFLLLESRESKLTHDKSDFFVFKGVSSFFSLFNKHHVNEKDSVLWPLNFISLTLPYDRFLRAKLSRSK